MSCDHPEIGEAIAIHDALIHEFDGADGDLAGDSKFGELVERGVMVLGRSVGGCGVEYRPGKGFLNCGDVALCYVTITAGNGAVSSCGPERARGEWEMADITALQEAVLTLPEEDYARFRAWFSELDWEKWDRQIEEDSEQGKLDFLIAEAQEAKERGRLQKL